MDWTRTGVIGLTVGGALLGVGLVLRGHGSGGLRGLGLVTLKLPQHADRAKCPACGEELGIEYEYAPTGFRSSAEVYDRLRAKLGKAKQEGFWVASLDSRHRLVDLVEVCRGGDRTCLVDPKPIFRRALARHAQAVIVVHNHPSGDPTPSVEDDTLTRRLVTAGKALDIPVLDHLVLGRGGYTSFADSGRMANIQSEVTSKLSDVWQAGGP